MPTPLHSDSSLSAQARDILIKNDRGGYTVPTQGLYPYQWNWDSAFVALGFAAFDRQRAWAELESLFQGQWTNGMVPHILFRVNDPGYFPGPDMWQCDPRKTGSAMPTSGITQPPVAASCVRELWELDGCSPEHPKLRALFPKLMAYTRWYRRFRDPLGNGLAMVVHNWETGRDNNPEWDGPLAAVDTSSVGPYTRRDTSHVNAAMRPTKQEYDRYVALLEFGRARGWDPQAIAQENPFRVLDVGITMMLLRADRDLLVLAHALGEQEAVAELQACIARAEQGIDMLWDESVGGFSSYDLRHDQPVSILSSASFLSFYAGVGSERQRAVQLEQLQRLGQSCRYLLPSLAPGSRTYDPMRYWRGPVWLVVSYMVAKGLREAGHHEWSHRIQEDSRQMIRESGFYESFSPETGQGTGGPDFSWTAAMWLHWCGT